MLKKEVEVKILKTCTTEKGVAYKDKSIETANHKYLVGRGLAEYVEDEKPKSKAKSKA